MSQAIFFGAAGLLALATGTYGAAPPTCAACPRPRRALSRGARGQDLPARRAAQSVSVRTARRVVKNASNFRLCVSPPPQRGAPRTEVVGAGAPVARACCGRSLSLRMCVCVCVCVCEQAGRTWTRAWAASGRVSPRAGCERGRTSAKKGNTQECFHVPDPQERGRERETS